MSRKGKTFKRKAQEWKKEGTPLVKEREAQRVEQTCQTVGEPSLLELAAIAEALGITLQTLELRRLEGFNISAYLQRR